MIDYKNNYTAFEVFITDKVISAGMTDTNDLSDVNSVANLFNFDNKTATGLTYTVDVPATPDMKVEIELKPENANEVSIDWGDGTEENPDISAFNDCYDGSKYSVKTYDKCGKFIIKVYGSIAAFRPRCPEVSAGTNPISRVWELDLPMADTVWNLYEACRESHRLLRVKVPTYNYKWSANPLKISRMFTHCRNMLSFEMGKNGLPPIAQMYDLFSRSINLKTIIWDPEDLGRFPQPQDGNYEFMYNECTSLETPVTRLLPMKAGWSTKHVRLSYALENCPKIPSLAGTEDDLTTDYGKIANLLWRAEQSGFNTFEHVEVFDNQISLSSQAPVSWGGTKADNNRQYSLTIKG